MRTTLTIEEGLLREVMQDTGAKTTGGVVNQALHEYMQMRRRQRVKALSGKISIVENWQELEAVELEEGV